VSAVVLSHRYISDRFLPDKAIDLVDEACAMLRTEIDSMPAELDELTRRLTRLEIEEAALSKGGRPGQSGRLEQLRRELADVRADTDALRAQSGRRTPGAMRKVQALRQEMEQVRQEPRRPNASTTSTAAEFRHGKLPSSNGGSGEEQQLAPSRQPAAAARGGHRGEIAAIVSRWTGYGQPARGGEREKLLRLDQVLHERVVVQLTGRQLTNHPLVQDLSRRMQLSAFAPRAG